MDQFPSTTVTHLRCEYGVNPLGVTTTAPRLSWQLRSEERGQRQIAYRILVASAPELLEQGKADLWDSGKTVSEESVHVPYGGTSLHSGQRCYWQVRVWDMHDVASPYSAPAYWQMGLLEECEWQAQWIGLKTDRAPYTGDLPAPLFRKSFTVRGPLARASLSICGLGYAVTSINGQRVGDGVLDPPYTNYDHRVLYQTHDVTAQLTPGENVIGAMLGNGFYNHQTVDEWNFFATPWRDAPKLLAQLQLEYADGSSELVITDPSWLVSSEGPVVFNGIRNGETYDARRELPGWDTAAFTLDDSWRPAELIDAPGGVVASQQSPSIKVTQTLTPVSMNEVKPGVVVFDMGQNFAGWAQLTVSGAAGTEVTLRYSELLGEDGDIDQTHIKMFVRSGDFQTDRYILRGEGVEVWEPSFTYHGFRYVQVTGFPGLPTLDALRGRVIHTAFAKAGEFSCSNEMLNAVQRCTVWSYISNFQGIPTDCPHREKNGWTGDAQLAAETGLYNFHAASAYEKWLDDIADTQRHSGQLPGIVPTGGWGYNWGSGPAWDSAFTLIPWYLHEYCGDTRVLARHYDGIKRYVDYMTRMSTDSIVSFGLGDWCAPENPPKTPEPLTSTAYYYVNCRVAARAAELLGEQQDAAYYTKLARQVKDAFNRHFFDAERGEYTVQTQTALSCALYQGLVEAEHRDKTMAQLVALVEAADNHLDCGILGTKYLLRALTDGGRADVAYRVAAQTSYPSWGHWIAQGATTLWESWSGGSSYNHIMFGDISAWCYAALAGINPGPDAAGFRHILIRPQPVGDLTWVRAEHQSAYGPIRSAWQRDGAHFTLYLTIPANTTALVSLPTTQAEGVREGDTTAAEAPGVRYLGTEDHRALFTVASGNYRFVAELEG